ncbi:MAG: hypothetical protein U0587_11525 [Candidatus Binatia bacterium]
MLRTIRIGALVGILAIAALQGCAINRESASVSPDADLSGIKKIYVVRSGPDGRAINYFIAADLKRRGFAATTGEETAVPADADAVVTYFDKWTWDLTMYMIELRIFIREPTSDALLAVGDSYHTSLTRKSPEEMVAEVLSNIFARGRDKPKTQ